MKVSGDILMCSRYVVKEYEMVRGMLLRDWSFLGFEQNMNSFERCTLCYQIREFNLDPKWNWDQVKIMFM